MCGAGANDVGMIQAAHIGVGISGREGRAAVLASDFAFAQFRFLARLLLLHGRWSHLRNAEIVQYAVYKNLVYCLCALYFGFVSGALPPHRLQPIISASPRILKLFRAPSNLPPPLQGQCWRCFVEQI